MIRALRLVGWNALLVIAGVGAVAVGAEAYLRLTAPFYDSSHPRSFHPQAGLVGAPGAEVRWTNRLDFWTISRNNSLGFLDREPPPPEQAAAGCHVAIIGDSFVEARQVPIADKLQVVLEEGAAERLPRADVTVSAFGVAATGQIAQLGFYDAFVRRLRPKLVVLVFTPNDLIDNFPAWKAAESGLHPRHMPYVFAAGEPGAGLRLRPPDPDWARLRLPSAAAADGSISWWRRAALSSWLAKWLTSKARSFDQMCWRRGYCFDLLGAFDQNGRRARTERTEALRQDPQLAAELAGWSHDTRWHLRGNEIPPLVDRALGYTAFALDQFTERARRDRFALVMLETSRTATVWGAGAVRARVRELAARRGIFVIDQAAYILHSGGDLQDAVWAHNDHWSPAGHRYAAAALLEYLQRHPEICDRPAAA